VEPRVITLFMSSINEVPVSLLKSELHGETVAALYKALAPWAVGLENIIWNQAAKSLGEVQLGVTVPSLFAGIQVGVGGLVMNVVNPDWGPVRRRSSRSFRRHLTRSGARWWMSFSRKKQHSVFM